jgi:hypothetical protein
MNDSNPPRSVGGAPKTPAEGTTVSTRRPKGYVGEGHETIGSDLLAVRDALVWMSGDKSEAAAATVCRQVLGAENAAKLDGVKAEGWYPIGWLLAMMDAIDGKIGPNGLRRMGRVLFQRSHAERAKAALHTGRDVVHAIDGLYNSANRGARIGGWKVLSFSSASAELEKTTPHHCVMEEGILAEACATVGASVMVTQRACFRQGADACIYVLVPSVIGRAWGG